MNIGLKEELPQTGDKFEQDKMLLQIYEKLKAIAERSQYSKYKNPVTAFENVCNLLTTQNCLKDQKGTNKEKFKVTVIQVWNDWKQLNQFPIQKNYEDINREHKKLPELSKMKQLNFVEFLARKKTKKEEAPTEEKVDEDSKEEDSIADVTVVTKEINANYLNEVESTIPDLAKSVGVLEISLTVRDLQENKVLKNEALAYVREIKIFKPLNSQFKRLQKYNLQKSILSTSIREAESNMVEVQRVLFQGQSIF